MKITKNFKSLFLTLSAIATTTLVATPKVEAVNFNEQQVDQNQFTVVAVPFGYKQHRLEVIEQIPGQQQCWSESGANPVKVDLLLLNYDYSNSCRRIINNNGYSIRINGKEDLTAYILKIVENNGELQLVAFHRDSTQPSIVIGKTNGLTDGAVKIMLNPGWQITKRIYDGKVVNHVYLSGNAAVAQNTYKPTSNSSVATTNPTPSTATNTPTATKDNNSTTTTAQSEVDTEAVAEGIAQIYKSVVEPWLNDMAEQNKTN
ncbi:MAG: hypothetical protein Tsb0014_15510 [Pleurocapsa sp.]